MTFRTITIEEFPIETLHTIPLRRIRKFVQHPDFTSVWEDSSDVPLQTRETVESLLERIEALEAERPPLKFASLRDLPLVDPVRVVHAAPGT